MPLAVFAVFSLRHEVKLDWTGAPWVAAVPALAYGIVHSAQAVQTGLRAWIRAAWAPTLAGLLLVSTLPDSTISLSAFPESATASTSELIPVGWQEFGARIRQLADDTEKASGKAPLIVGMDRYAIASELAFYAPDRAKSVSETTSAHLFGQVGLMYERWFPVSRAGRAHAAAGCLGPRRSRLAESRGERRAAGSHRRGPHHARQPGHPALLLPPR